MKVIDHQPHAWLLLEDESGLLIDVDCHHGAVSCSVLIRLNDQELAEYRRDGHAYLDRLAQAIHYSAPILAISDSPYKPRKLRGYDDQVLQAIRQWQAQGRPGGAANRHD
ncbi:hypothetical protein [Pseudomonas sp. PA27(2017)]|uniref:hypothetical protein n=1 Tax=Pseudomonas sp. PA27(2017) TaxID=1932112 RepID=UPI00096025E8|nr:hypothetical protein [Pseudomonas sp. PA27(2017)]OLU32998.1 hypothetical protein BVH06_09655 [Pseudomonas sp. PA27(2017)]